MPVKLLPYIFVSRQNKVPFPYKDATACAAELTAAQEAVAQAKRALEAAQKAYEKAKEDTRIVISDGPAEAPPPPERS